MRVAHFWCKVSEHHLFWLICMIWKAIHVARKLWFHTQCNPMHQKTWNALEFLDNPCYCLQEQSLLFSNYLLGLISFWLTKNSQPEVDGDDDDFSVTCKRSSVVKVSWPPRVALTVNYNHHRMISIILAAIPILLARTWKSHSWVLGLEFYIWSKVNVKCLFSLEVQCISLTLTWWRLKGTLLNVDFASKICSICIIFLYQWLSKITLRKPFVI